LILVGNETLPTNFEELMTLLILAFLSTILIGVIIGEFASLLFSFTKKERMKSEEADAISNVMLTLRISEHIQNRVHEYYDKITESMFIHNSSVYDLLSPPLVNTIKLYQADMRISSLSFINPYNLKQMESFAKNLEIVHYLEGDIIIKQGDMNEYFYYMHDGLAEVIMEFIDFIYFDYQSVAKFVSQIKDQQK